MNTDRMIFIGISGVTLIILGIILFSSLKTSVNLVPETFLKQATHYKGKEDAKVTLVEFSDYECPYCAEFYPEVDKLAEKYKDNLRVAYVHFPLPQHKGALPAAKAAEAADKQSKFWEYSKELFLNQPNFSDEDLEKYAKTVGLDIEKFNNDRKSKEVEEKVFADRAFGEKVRIQSTPSFYILNDGKATLLRLNQNTDLENAIKPLLGEPKTEPTNDGKEPAKQVSDEDVNKAYDSIIKTLKGDLPKDSATPVKAAVKELISTYNALKTEEFSLVSVIAKEWPDSGLGCNKEGQMSAQVITPGFEVKFKAKDAEVIYRTNTKTLAVSCQ